jgi:hypothetical protein
MPKGADGSDDAAILEDQRPSLSDPSLGMTGVPSLG